MHARTWLHRSTIVSYRIALHCMIDRIAIPAEHNIWCIALHSIYIALHCIALHCSRSHGTQFNCIPLNCTELHRIALQCAPLVRPVKLAHLHSLHCYSLPPPLHSPWHCRTLDSRVYKSFFSRTLELLCVRMERKKGRTMSQPSPLQLAKQSQFPHFVSAYNVIASDIRWWEGWRWKQTANNSLWKVLKL